MKSIKSILSLIILGLFLVFAMQNNIPVDFKFFMFNIPRMPLFVIIIVIFIVGFLFGRFTSWINKTFTNKKPNPPTK